MKAAVFHGPEDVRFEEIDKPVLKDGEVLIKVRACGICGSDLHTYKHGMFLQLGTPIESGRVLGHEFSGEIAEVGGDVTGAKVGDRVVSIGIGGNAEYVKISNAMNNLLIPLSESVSFEEGATTEPLATSLHGVNLAKPADGETHVIMGAGIIGLGVLQAIKFYSSAKVIVVDLSDKRLDMARSLGADVTINAAREDVVETILGVTGSKQLGVVEAIEGNVDTVFDCAGVGKNFEGTSVLAQSLSLVKQNGKVIVVAIFEKSPEIDYNIVVRKGIQIMGSWAWTPEEFTQAAELISSGKIDRKPLISHTFPLEDASEAYETQLRAEEAVKVILKPV
jgi:2-desacetyl-2-hydroxyethyl bacteriochlorophyllide A dehydrogenase